MKREHSAGIGIYKKSKNKTKFLFLIKDNGRIDLPKGHIENKESEVEAALRETKEETGLTGEIERFAKKEINYFFFNGKEKIFKKLTMFLGRIKKGKIKISEEHASYKWMTADEAIKKVKFKNEKELIEYAEDYVKKIDLIKKINNDYASLPLKCKDWKISNRFVPGEGPLDAKIFLIGQAPGAKEDIEKRPFVGPSGKLLDDVIKKSGLTREQLYITSVVQFYPPKNRAPSKDKPNNIGHLC